MTFSAIININSFPVFFEAVEEVKVDIYNIDDHKVPNSATSILFFKVGGKDIVNCLMKKTEKYKNIKTIRMEKCSMDINIVSALNHVHKQYNLLKSVEINQCKEVTLVNLNEKIGNYSVSIIEESSSSGIAEDPMSNMLNQVFRSMISGGRDPMEKSMNSHSQLIYNHINMMDETIKIKLLDLFKKNQANQNKGGDDNRDGDRLNLIPQLPAFKFPTFIALNDKDRSKKVEMYKKFFMSIADRMMVGYEKNKHMLVNNYLKVISEQQDGKQKFPEHPLFFVGQPGVGKTSSAHVCSAITAAIDFLFEYHSTGEVNWEKMPPMDANGNIPQEVFDKILLLSTEESCWINYFAHLRLEDQNDVSTLKGFAQAYKGSEQGLILNLILKGGFQYSTDKNFPIELKKKGYWSNGVCRKRSSVVLLLDEIDKFSDKYDGKTMASVLMNVVDNGRENYQDTFFKIPLDFTKIFVMLAGNQEKNLPAAFKDRLNIIHISGFTRLEKIQLIRALINEDQYPVDFDRNYIKTKKVQFDDKVFAVIVDLFGISKLGFRGLQRALNSIANNAILSYEQTKKNIVVNEANLTNYVDESLLNEMSQSKYTNDNRKGFLEVHLQSKHHEFIQCTIMVAQYPFTHQHQKFSIIGKFGDISDRGQHYIDGDFDKTMQSIIYSLPNNLTHSIKPATTTNIHTIYFSEEIYIKEFNIAMLYATLAVISYIKKQPLDNTKAVIASVDTQGMLNSVDALFDRIKLTLTNRPSIKTLILSERDKKCLVPIQQLLEKEGKTVEIKFVSDLASVIELILPTRESN